MQRRISLGLILALILILGSLGIAQAQDQSLYWQRYDVNIKVQQNSDMLVEEVQDIAFTSGSFHFGYATIPLNRVDRITDVQVSEVINGAERPYTPGSTSAYGFVTSTNNDNLEITWYFPSTSNSTHTYILRYRVVGGLRFYQDGDQVWWKAIASDHNFPIRASRVTVSLPTTVPQDQLTVASYGAQATSQYNQGQVVFDAQNIPAGQELEVRVQFPTGIVQGSAPAWQAAFDRQQTLGPVLSVIFGGLGLLLLAGGPLGVYLLWHTRGRDLPVGVVPEYISEPPSNLPAGVVGVLVDEQADVKDIVASIVDLARRGALRMEEEKKEGFLGIGSGSDFIFHLQDAGKATRPYEKTLIKRVFSGRDERRMSDLRQKFYTAIPELRQELYTEVVQEGFFPRDPQTTRRMWTGLGLAGMIVAGIIAFFLLVALGNYSGWVVCPGVSLGVTMAALMIAGRYMPRKTPKGAEEAAKWLAFKNYLKSLNEQSDLEAVKNKFETFLPYAVAFGLERTLINKFAKVDAPAPTWWGPVYMPGRAYGGYTGGMRGASVGQTGGPPGPLAGEGGKTPSLSGMSQNVGNSLASMSAGLGTMLSSASTVLTSTPPSSSSGSGKGWSGGGWSGGGFGGGGGGGGGGRGFG